MAARAGAGEAPGGESGAPEGFVWPEFRSFPPFYTIQPVEQTRERQLAVWRDLVVRFCRAARLFVLTTDESDDGPLFQNEAINRKLPASGRVAVLDSLAARGQAHWLDKHKRRCAVFFRPLEELADDLEKWARDMGYSGSVVTFDEISSGPETSHTDLHGMHHDALRIVAGVLERRGRAAVFASDVTGDEGIKFL
ncbi:unnamed protein product [Pedinophyceae sp. YPF-701]|nr:unnamed protein product [Pedinophyceae sp. YPF-701]